MSYWIALLFHYRNIYFKSAFPNVYLLHYKVCMNIDSYLTPNGVQKCKTRICICAVLFKYLDKSTFTSYVES